MTEFGNFEEDQEDKQQLENWASERDFSLSRELSGIPEVHSGKETVQGSCLID